MKRILAIIIFFFIASVNSYAVFFIDGYGAYINAGDLKNQLGGGLGLGTDINSDLNFLFRAASTSATENPDDPDEVNYEHLTALAGVEFVPQIQELRNYRLSWKTSILAGISNSEVEMENVSGKSDSEMGFACAIWTGLQYDVTQVVAPFIDLGYHSSFYRDKMKDASVQGYQVAFGIRFYLTGNRDYTGDYQ